MKVILTLTLPGFQDSKGLIVCHTFLESLRPGCDVTAHAEDGTLLLDGVVHFSQLNTLRSRPSLDLIIDVKPSTSCESSVAHAEPEQSGGISFTNPSLPANRTSENW